MADDSMELLENHAFHPTDPAHGVRSYDLGALLPSQQRSLNQMKMTQREENEKYFGAHPEIRAIIAILIRHILQKKPFTDLHETVGSFFSRPRFKLATELLDYLLESDYDGPMIDMLQKIIYANEAESSTSEDGVELC